MAKYYQSVKNKWMKKVYSTAIFKFEMFVINTYETHYYFLLQIKH